MSVTEKASYLPMEHMHKLLSEIHPSMRYDGSTPPELWQKNARKKLCELLGMDKIKPFACEGELTVEFDRINKGKNVREIRFCFFSEEGVIVPCHVMIPLGAAKPLPVVICLQGHSTGMHISIGNPIYPGDEDRITGGDRDFAVRSVKEGFCAVAIEQRCFGECGGTEKGPNCRQAALRALLLGRTLIGERVWDIMRTIDVLEENFSDLFDMNRILCLGNSGGGTATIYTSALDERIKIAVPSCALAGYADSIGAISHCECNYVPGIAACFDMGELCAMIAPRGLVVVSGEEDGIFPKDAAKTCFAEAKRMYTAYGAGDKCYHIFGTGGHRFYADDAWPTIHKLIDTP